MAIRNLIACAVFSILLVTPWTTRNYQCFGVFMPIKSNVGFEVWQSQCMDDDGLLDSELLALSHPYNNSAERQRYTEVGELQYVADNWKQVELSLSDLAAKWWKFFGDCDFSLRRSRHRRNSFPAQN